MGVTAPLAREGVHEPAASSSEVLSMFSPPAWALGSSVDAVHPDATSPWRHRAGTSLGPPSLLRLEAVLADDARGHDTHGHPGIAAGSAAQTARDDDDPGAAAPALVRQRD